MSAAIQAARGFGDWDGLRAGQLEVLAAEREVARIAGEEFAVDVDFGLPWSIGAPLPHLLANGDRAFLLFYLANPDPDWGGTSVRIVDPAVTGEEPLGVVEFQHVHSVTL